MSEAKTYKLAVVPKANAPFEIVERPIPEPKDDEVLLKVEACGVCHSDCIVKYGFWPAPIQYPRAPGHEVVGRVAKAGKNASEFKEGQRVGVGWFFGACHACDNCRRGDFITCSTHRVTGITTDGGYGEYMVALKSALVYVPEGISSAEAAPLLCAGVTVYNSLRNVREARPGDVVAVQGVGGLGHLGIQYARKMGFHTVCISTGSDKKELATKLGAHVYIDSSKEDAVAILQKLGGAKVVLATAPNSKAMSALVDGLGVNGTLLILGADAAPLTISPFQLIGQRKRIQGWPSGQAQDSDETLKFSVLSDVKPMIETFPLSKANEALAHMEQNKVRFRAVIVFDDKKENK